MRLFPALVPDVVHGLEWRVWTSVALSVDQHEAQLKKDREEYERSARRKGPRLAGRRR